MEEKISKLQKSLLEKDELKIQVRQLKTKLTEGEQTAEALKQLEKGKNKVEAQFGEEKSELLQKINDLQQNEAALQKVK